VSGELKNRTGRSQLLLFRRRMRSSLRQRNRRMHDKQWWSLPDNESLLRELRRNRAARSASELVESEKSW